MYCTFYLKKVWLGFELHLKVEFSLVKSRGKRLEKTMMVIFCSTLLFSLLGLLFSLFFYLLIALPRSKCQAVSFVFLFFQYFFVSLLRYPHLRIYTYCDQLTVVHRNYQTGLLSGHKNINNIIKN